MYEKVETFSSQDDLRVVPEVVEKLEAKESSTLDINAVFEKAASKYGNTLQKLAQ